MVKKIFGQKKLAKNIFFQKRIHKNKCWYKKVLFGKSYLWVIVVKITVGPKKSMEKIFVKISPPYARAVAMTAIQTNTLEIPFLK